MKSNHYLKLFLFGLLFAATTALACPGKDAALCKTNECPHTIKGEKCDTKMCDSKMKPLDAKQSCHTKAPNCSPSSHGFFMKDLRYTLKNLNLKPAEWSDVKIAFQTYKEDLKKIEMVSPLKSFEKAAFDRAVFTTNHPLHKKIAAQADLLETVFLLLNEDQKKRFIMLMGASQYQNSLHPQASCH